MLTKEVWYEIEYICVSGKEWQQLKWHPHFSTEAEVRYEVDKRTGGNTKYRAVRKTLTTEVLP